MVSVWARQATGVYPKIATLFLGHLLTMPGGDVKIVSGIHGLTCMHNSEEHIKPQAIKSDELLLAIIAGVRRRALGNNCWRKRLYNYENRKDIMKKLLNDKSLFERIAETNFKPAHVAEVGVYKPQTSNIYHFIKAGIKTTLVEPDPKSILQIKEHFSGHNNVTLHEVAIFDRTGEIELVQREASTFVSELKASPAILNDNYQVNETDKFVVQAMPFDKIDDGTIDLLSVDVEGAEWYVLKTMQSRPIVISLETHGAAYINPISTK